MAERRCAALAWLALVARWPRVRVITRLRLDAALDDPPPREVDIATDTALWDHAGKPPVALRWVLMRDPQARCTPQALLSTHPEHPCEQMLAWCGRRWTMEVTCDAARAHLGMAPQHQGNDRAIARTTPAPLRLSSIVTLPAHLLLAKGVTWVRSTAW